MIDKLMISCILLLFVRNLYYYGNCYVNVFVHRINDCIM